MLKVTLDSVGHQNQLEGYKMELSHYTTLSKLFEYPDESYYSHITNMISELATKYPDASKELEAFSKLVPTDIYKLQELYTKSFEVQAVTSLEIGYLLYGDDYTRGEVMVGLNQEHRAVGNELGTELSDHLSNVLRLLPKMQDETVINDLVTMMVAPAVEVMMHEYTPKNMEAKDKLYKKQYKTLIIPLIKENKPFGDASFIGFLSSELEVEEGKKSSNSSCGPTFDTSGVMTSSGCGSSCA